MALKNKLQNKHNMEFPKVTKYVAPEQYLHILHPNTSNPIQRLDRLLKKQ